MLSEGHGRVLTGVTTDVGGGGPAPTSGGWDGAVVHGLRCACGKLREVASEGGVSSVVISDRGGSGAHSPEPWVLAVGKVWTGLTKIDSEWKLASSACILNGGVTCA